MNRGSNVHIYKYKVSLRRKSAENVYRQVNLNLKGSINGMHMVENSNACCVSEILVIKSSWVSPTRRASMRSSKYHRFPHGHFIPSCPLPLSQRSWWLNRHESPPEGEPQWGVANIIDFLIDMSSLHVPSCYRSSAKGSKMVDFFRMCLRDLGELSRHESPPEGEPPLGVANIIDFLMDVLTPIYVWSFVNGKQ